ncbi:hypothetical protein F5144DRAFT_606380 [Chaetomium tenue]|uniref:Uncharacterized protein n=1 Tax=Chaetomium tenue TaxID=1854479 RepID=A0ACB7P068_9PEZI|nr:hypothetical protein F5144DRAFT_606380 [Chaetomium globosum]
MYPIPEANGQPSHLDAGSYTNHARSSSRTSWDGVRVPLPASHSPPQSPPRSPRLRASHRPRPPSVVSLPDHALGRPIGLPDRWSYDRERMPSPPPAARGSRPGTPLSDWEPLEAAFSRPASTLIESRSSSRPPSILLSASTELGGHSHTASTPTLRLHPPPFGDSPQEQQQQPNHRHSYHLLTPEEMELLAHPPPLQRPMTASPQSPPHSPQHSPSPSPRHSPSHTPSPGDSTTTTTPTTTPKHPPNTTQQAQQPHPYNENDNDDNESEPSHKPSRCTNLCELTPGRQVCGQFGAWLVGMALPITFGAVTGCLLGFCR